MLIFQIFKWKKFYREFRENPSKASTQELVQFLVEIIILPFIIAGAIIVFVFIIGFTDLIWPAMSWARTVFYILLPIFLLLLYIAKFILNKVKKSARRIGDDIVKKAYKIRVLVLGSIYLDFSRVI